MDFQSAVDYTQVPSLVAYKSALKSPADHIRDTRKVTVIPTSGGQFGPGSQTEATIMIDDGGAGAFLHPDSCYMTCDITTTDAVGGGAITNTANFNSSANDIIDRVIVRGKRSRVMLADCRDYNVWSALRDKLRYPEAYKGKAPWSRGFVIKTVDPTDGTKDKNYGLYSRGVANVEQLKDTTRRFKLSLEYCPFFTNKLIVPLASSGGIELSISFARIADSFVGYATDNTTGTETCKDYKVTNLRFHCQISYMNERFMREFESHVNSGGVPIPYDSYLSLSHVPQSNNESVRLSSNLEHLKAVFAVHRFTGDLNDIKKASLAHFGNPGLTEIQLSSGGITQPSVPLICSTDDGKAVSGQMLEELEQAARAIDPHLGDLEFDIASTQIALASSLPGTATNPVLADVSKWNGTHIVGLTMDSGQPFTSIYNRTNSTMQTPVRKTDLVASMKYAGNPSSFTSNFFLYHSNVLRVRKDGMLVPEQLSF